MTTGRFGERLSHLLRRAPVDEPRPPAARFAWHAQPLGAKGDWEHVDEGATDEGGGDGVNRDQLGR